jgi:LacI family transcriptional regulator
MSAPTKVRLKDVAEAANVSLAAASRILRGDRERFGEATCRRVVETARRLGWRRNLLVNGMQTGRTNTVGVMIPPFDSYWVDVLSGIHEALSSADFLPITVWIGDPDDMLHCELDEAEGLALINRLLDRRVDGLILWPPFSDAYYHRFPELVERRVPATVIDGESAGADSVGTDEAQATAAAAEHLLQLGHRRIACMSSCETPMLARTVKRRECFEQAVLGQRGAAVKSWRLNAQGNNGLEVARQILSDDWRPTSVFAVSDHQAKCLYQVAAEMGLVIPRDLSVVGFGDLDSVSSLAPPLTTMRPQPREIGRLAARLITDRIDGPLNAESNATTIRVEAELFVRGSTAAPNSGA